MEYTGHFTITKKDNIDFNFLLMRKRLIRSSLVVFILVLALVTFLNAALKQMALPDALLQGLLMGALGVVLMFGVNIASMYLRIGAMYRNRKIQDFAFDVVVDKDGFHAKSARGDADVPWNRILSLRETKNAFYIFISENNANVLPKTQMRLPADAELMRALAKQYLEPARCKLQA